MSIYVLNNSEISGIAHFAAKNGIGLANVIGNILHQANLECWNDRYSKTDVNKFELEDVCYDAEQALEALHCWMINTASSLAWFETHSCSKLYNRIRQLCFSPEVLTLQTPETRFGYTVGQAVLFKLANSAHAGYVVGFKQNMASKVYGSNGLEDNCGNEIEVVLASQLDKSIYLTSAPVEYIAVDEQLTSMPAAQALNAKNILVMKADAEKLARENERELQLNKEKAFADEIRKIMPVDTKAVIVASRQVYNHEQSDPMSDYHKVDDTETIILGFSKHNRALFSELRKFAKTNEKTAFLADLSKDHEDRYGYSNKIVEKRMGHAHGWYVEKIKFYRDDFEQNVKSVPMGDIEALKAPKKTKSAKVIQPKAAPLPKSSFNQLLFASA